MAATVQNNPRQIHPSHGHTCRNDFLRTRHIPTMCQCLARAQVKEPLSRSCHRRRAVSANKPCSQQPRSGLRNGQRVDGDGGRCSLSGCRRRGIRGRHTDRNQPGIHRPLQLMLRTRELRRQTDERINLVFAAAPRSRRPQAQPTSAHRYVARESASRSARSRRRCRS